MNRSKDMAKQILAAGLPMPRIVRPVIRGLYRGGVWIKESLVLIRKWFFVEPVLRSVATVGKHLRVDRIPYIRGKGILTIGDHVNLSGQSCFYFMEKPGPSIPSISIGNRTFVGHGCTFSAARNIVIGSECLVSAGVRIHDNDGHPMDAAKRRAGETISLADVQEVRIEDGVWIGAGAVILKGVTIGRDSVIGAGAVVTRDVSAGSTVAGNPARDVTRTELSGER